MKKLRGGEENLDQPSTKGPASNNCDSSHVSRYTIPAESCMQGEIILSSVPSCPPNHAYVVNNKKRIHFMVLLVSNPGMHWTEKGKVRTIW